jgi:hypothetical protein
MTRCTGSVVVALMLVASGRLLVCDYSCVGHTRAVQSSEPSCHEQAREQVPVAVTASQNSCEQPVLVADFLAGKVTSLVKPAPAVAHAVDEHARAYTLAGRAPARAPDTLSPAFHRNPPLRI